MAQCLRQMIRRSIHLLGAKRVGLCLTAGAVSSLMWEGRLLTLRLRHGITRTLSWAVGAEGRDAGAIERQQLLLTAWRRSRAAQHTRLI